MLASAERSAHCPVPAGERPDAAPVSAGIAESSERGTVASMSSDSSVCDGFSAMVSTPYSTSEPVSVLVQEISVGPVIQPLLYPDL